MKDLLKKLAGLLVCLSLVTSLAACGGSKKDSDKDSKSEEVSETEKSNKNKDPEEPEDPEDPEETDQPEKTQKPTESDEELVEEVVLNYAEAVLSLDFGEAINYLSEDTEEYEEFSNMKDVGTGIDALVDLLFEDFESSGLPADSMADMKVLVSDAMNDLMSKIDVEIASVKIDGNEATVEITGTSPDFESDFESVLTSALESSFEDAFTEEALLEKYGEEVLAGIQSEEEAMELIMPDMLVLMEDAFSSAIDDIELVEMNSVYVLNNIDGEWLIVSVEEA